MKNLLLTICILTIIGPSFTQINLDSGLVGYFMFDGNLADSSSFLQHGVPYHLTSGQGICGDSNTAYTFNGTNAYVNAGVGNRGITSTVSISAWVKTTGLSGHMVSKYHWPSDKGYFLALNNGVPKLKGRNNGNAYIETNNTTPNIADGIWHHLIGIIQGNLWELYVDGVLVGSAQSNSISPLISNSISLSIGRYELGLPSGDHLYFSGNVDNVRMYNRALNYQERNFLAHFFCPVYDTIQAFSCDPYIWAQNSQTYSSSGMFLDTIVHPNGPDTVKVLDLTVPISSVTTSFVQVCSSYVSPSGNYTWNSNGTYLDTIPSAMGCDSILEITLEIGNSFNSQSITHCGPMWSPSGSKLWEESGLYLDTIITPLGCDSVLEINLNVIDINTSLTTDSSTIYAWADSNYTYQWIDCNSQMPIPGETNDHLLYQKGMYAVKITQGNCIDTSDCITINGMGMQFQDLQNVIVYPNPAKQLVNLTGLLPNSHLVLRDATGRIIYRKMTLGWKDQINVGNLSAGLYLLEVGNKRTKRIIRLIVE